MLFVCVFFVFVGGDVCLFLLISALYNVLRPIGFAGVCLLTSYGAIIDTPPTLLFCIYLFYILLVCVCVCVKDTAAPHLYPFFVFLSIPFAYFFVGFSVLYIFLNIPFGAIETCRQVCQTILARELCESS